MFPREERVKAWEDARVSGIERNKRLQRYAVMLRLCLIPLEGTSPIGDPEEWPAHIRSEMIEDFRECALWSLMPASELMQRNIMVALVKFVTSGQAGQEESMTL